MSQLTANMTAIVLAGQRDGEDALAEYAGAACKAAIEIAGKPMLQRVLETLRTSPSVGKIIVSGQTTIDSDTQQSLSDVIEVDDITWLSPQSSPSRSAYAALCELPPDDRILLTTADHPLLTPEIVGEFCARSAELDADLVVGFAPYSLVQENFPDMKKTVLHFDGIELCGCNLFAFLTPAGREAADYWRQVEAQRKSPLRVIRILGLLNLAKYFVGKLTLDAALQAMSRNLGLNVRAVILPYGDAAVDVDSVSDYRFVQAAFAARAESPAHSK